jgi:hypothetical protein
VTPARGKFQVVIKSATPGGWRTMRIRLPGPVGEGLRAQSPRLRSRAAQEVRRVGDLLAGIAQRLPCSTAASGKRGGPREEAVGRPLNDRGALTRGEGGPGRKRALGCGDRELRIGDRSIRHGSQALTGDRANRVERGVVAATTGAASMRIRGSAPSMPVGRGEGGPYLAAEQLHRPQARCLVEVTKFSVASSEVIPAFSRSSSSRSVTVAGEPAARKSPTT